MPAPIDPDLRIRALKAARKGASRRSTADRFDVAHSTVIRWCECERKYGRTVAKKMGGDRRSHRTKRLWPKILRMIRRKRDITLKEISGRLAKMGERVSSSAIWRLLRSKNFTWKRKTGHASEQERADVKKKRENWKKMMRTLPAARLFFIDECCLRTNMGRSRGWSRRWERRRASFPFGHRCTTTLIAALSLKGIVAPLLLDGPMNGDAFFAWVEQMLARELREGDIVVCDNLSTHRIAGARKILESVGAKLLFLPPYSPDLNPIEKAFAQIKFHLGKIAARSQKKLYAATGTVVDLVTPENARNYFSYDGYQCDPT